MFPIHKMCTRFRYNNDSHVNTLHDSSSEFIISGLENHIGKIMTLELVMPDSRDKHKYASLKIIRQKSDISLLPGNIIQVIICYECVPGLKIDFLSIEKFKASDCPKGDSASRNSARIRLRIFLDDETMEYETMSNIIRHMDPNVTNDLKVISVGIPFDPSLKKSICVTFEKPLVYFENEIYLLNGFNQIIQQNKNTFNYPSRHFIYNLGLFLNQDFSSLIIHCPDYNKHVTLPSSTDIRNMFYNMISIRTLQSESIFANNKRNIFHGNKDYQISNNSAGFNSRSEYFSSRGEVIRFRYQSEIKEGFFSSFPLLRIQNLRKLLEGKICLDLVKSKEDIKHPYLEFYFATKKKNSINGFYINENGSVIGRLKDVDELSLSFLGIQISKAGSNQKDIERNSCRIRLTLDNNDSFVQFSNVIRNLNSKQSSDIVIKSIAPSLQNECTEKKIMICLEREVPYYLEEFELFDGNKRIEAESSTKVDKIQEICFNLAKYNGKIFQENLKLKCETFNREVKINVKDYIYPIYPDLTNWKVTSEEDKLVGSENDTGFNLVFDELEETNFPNKSYKNNDFDGEITPVSEMKLLLKKNLLLKKSLTIDERQNLKRHVSNDLYIQNIPDKLNKSDANTRMDSNFDEIEKNGFQMKDSNNNGLDLNSYNIEKIGFQIKDCNNNGFDLNSIDVEKSCFQMEDSSNDEPAINDKDPLWPDFYETMSQLSPGFQSIAEEVLRDKYSFNGHSPESDPSHGSMADHF